MSDHEQSLIVFFGQRIKTLRHHKKLSQEELADIAEVHRTYIGMIERGEKNATLQTIEKLSKALDVRIHALFEGF